jgi:hypothetical protein
MVKVIESTYSSATPTGAKSFLQSKGPAPAAQVAVTEPLRIKEELASVNAACEVVFAFSVLNRPVVITVNANTAATTTNAINIIAVSNPVTPELFCENLFNLFKD